MPRLFTKNHQIKTNQGFTLVEMLVATTLFSAVMVISIGALLSMVDAGRRAQATQSVMNNLNVALDGAVRALRMGSDYSVSNSNKTLSFTPYGSTDTWIYSFNESDGRIYKTYIPEGFVSAVTIPITAAEVEIEEAKFYVTGISANDNKQPRVLLILRGEASISKDNVTTRFDIQASATQRVLDL